MTASCWTYNPTSGRSIVTVLAHLGGRSVAILANDPSVLAGTIDSDAADKAAHFLDVADAFGLPCVFLADNPGVLAGTAAERQGILRHAARLFAVQHRLNVPKLHVTLRKVFGFGSSVMAMNPFDGQTITLAFPSITLGALPAGSGGLRHRRPRGAGAPGRRAGPSLGGGRRPVLLRRRHRPPRAAQRPPRRSEPRRGSGHRLAPTPFVGRSCHDRSDPPGPNSEHVGRTGTVDGDHLPGDEPSGGLQRKSVR